MPPLTTPFADHFLPLPYHNGVGEVRTLDTSEGELIHEFGALASDPGRFARPFGICVDYNGLVHAVDSGNERVQVF